MKLLVRFILAGKQVEFHNVEESDYIRQLHYRDEWEPPQSSSGKTLSKGHEIVIIVNSIFIDFL